VTHVNSTVTGRVAGIKVVAEEVILKGPGRVYNVNGWEDESSIFL
jgi:hypothetical protein